MTVTNELIDSLLANYRRPEGLISENGLLKLLTQKLVERALQAQMAEHLGHAKNDTVATRLTTPVTARARKPSKTTLVNCP
jgi:putative transposase